LFAGVAGLTPRRLCLWSGARLGDVLFVLGFYRHTVRKNMEFVGLWPADEQDRIARRLYRNMGRYAFELLQPADRVPVAVIEGEAIWQRIGADPAQGALVIFAHLGNWEILPVILSRTTKCLSIIAKPMRNPLVEKWIRRRRQCLGVILEEPRNALRHCLRALKQHASIAIAIDQYPGSKGTPSVFLGQRALTVRTSAGLAARTGCPVTGVYALLDEQGVYRVRIESVPTPQPADAEGDAVSATLQAHNALISRWVTEHPEHWFGWFHRRFKDSISY
jgi:KDO2-lipid IV(A) lauroyltransferase